MKDFRNDPDYGALECYAQEDERGENIIEKNNIRKEHINEIRVRNPQVWQTAQKDFEIYRNWVY